VNVAVAEKYHGRGIGKLLVKDAIQKAKGKGIKQLRLVLEIQALDNLLFIKDVVLELLELI
jgi:GNAT superfamily N-acetyltransferase